MKERIVFTNQDGSVGVLIPTGEISIEEVMKKDVPAGATNARQITTDELPTDRTFRGAWDDSNPENFVGTNMTKAKGIAHGMRRANREDKMTPLDKENNFVSTNTTRKTAIKAEKQSILDTNATVQTNIDSATDEASLRSVLSKAAMI